MEVFQQVRRKLPHTHRASPVETLPGAHTAWALLGDVEDQTVVQWSPWREWDEGESAENQFTGQVRDALMISGVPGSPRAGQGGTDPMLA